MNIPPFTITSKINNLVANISEQIGILQGKGIYQTNLHLRKANRIRTIKGTTAIEGNSLTHEQITDIVSGKVIAGNPAEIKEVKNAYEAYENIDKFKPYETKDLLKAHGILTNSLIENSGRYRDDTVGVFNGKDVIHLGSPYYLVPELVNDLLEWAKTTDVHPLIKSSVVHYELEFIHPFQDGNGRVGRFWQTVILSKWYDIFSWIPVETMIYENHQKYYEVLAKSDAEGNSTLFIEFMLEVIAQTLENLPQNKITDIITDIITDKLSKEDILFLEAVLPYLQKNSEINNYKAQFLTNKSSEAIKKYFQKFVEYGILIAER
ncbi:MAG: Fic family protein [Lachnospiraceae bacterium]|jgi:Fic family protein|nr:Fic family protein [Lachnospiraceae bacterium]